MVALSAGKIRAEVDGPEFEQWLAKPIGSAELAAILGGVAPPEQDRWSAALRRLDGRRELLVQLAHDLRDGLPPLLTALRSAAEAGDSAEVSRLAHLLVGQASVFTAEELIAAARTLEDEATAGKPRPESLAAVLNRGEQLAAELAEL